MNPARKPTSNLVRDYVRERFVEQARRHGQRSFSVNAGDVHRALGLHQRVPLVCTSLDSDKFLRENGLRLIEKSGPPSGLSTSVTFTYEFAEPEVLPSPDLFGRLRGIASDMFRAVGGGEEFIRHEREEFDKESTR